MPAGPRTARQITLLVRLNDGPVIDPAFEASDVSLEDVVLAYMGQDAPSAPAQLSSIGEKQ